MVSIAWYAATRSRGNPPHLITTFMCGKCSAISASCALLMYPQLASMSLNVFMNSSMTWFWRMSTPKKILSESARGWRRDAETNRTWGWLRNRCGERLLYTLNFRCEQQFYDSYSHYAWIGKSCLRHLPISTPPQRNAYLISLTTRLFGHPQEVSVENFQILKNVKDQFYFIWLSLVLNVLIQVLYYIFWCLSRIICTN